MAKNNNSNRKGSMINLLQEKISATPNLKKFPSLSNENHDEKHGNSSLEVLAQNKQKQLMEVLRKRKNVNLQKISLTQTKNRDRQGREKVNGNTPNNQDFTDDYP